MAISQNRGPPNILPNTEILGGHSFGDLEFRFRVSGSGVGFGLWLLQKLQKLQQLCGRVGTQSISMLRVLLGVKGFGFWVWGC